MTPRPFYRWKSFWLGLCVLVFLGWAWVWSMDEALILTPWDESRLSLSTGNGQLDAFVSDAYRALGPARVEHWRTDPDSMHWFPPPFQSRTVDHTGQGTSVAYWLVIAMVFLVWSAWLFFHWKREQKKSS
jgi:hypothetical protein